ncbi:MAG: SEL1-like repeat protein [Kangiellaceae bacterium]|nr:SEL1-like repeat protein [Kangiellaceae bacterium]
MNKIPLYFVLLFNFLPTCVNAASNKEVNDYQRATEIGDKAIKLKNYEKAFKHLEIASKLGNKTAQYSLAILYMNGLGVEKDYNQAYLWLNVASEAKVSKWRKLRDKLKTAFSEEQKSALAPHVESYLNKYGEKIQDVSCYKRAPMGSNRKIMTCTKRLDKELISI